MLHDIIQSARLPDFLRRPPPHTGTKQGGSLTADQLHTLISVIFPIAIPVICNAINQASADQRALEEYRRKKVEHACLAAEQEAVRRALGTNAPALPPLLNAPRPPPRRPKRGKQQLPTQSGQGLYPYDQYLLEEDESDPETLVHTSIRKADNASIVELALAVQKLTGWNTTTEEQEDGRMYLRRYLTTFAKICGLESMAPNHHLSTHIQDQLTDYGPAPQMWAYGSERLTRELKNTRTNRHTGGPTIEDTYANVFFRRQTFSAQVQSIAESDSDPLGPWARLSMQRGEDC
ncbi:Transposase family Tnp2 domain-containing protein [Ceratobasidium sp. AG-Ba]|nr:Transposase family Tnp2 domain-containing protein [Ceratobasidium sp. AG-Ba]